jgi:hypothetical protein
MIEAIPYSPSLPIINLAMLPGGTGANYLECFKSDSEKGRELVACKWRRKLPSGIPPNHLIVIFAS